MATKEPEKIKTKPNVAGGGFPVLRGADIKSEIYRHANKVPTYDTIVQVIRCTSDDLNDIRTEIWPLIREDTPFSIGGVVQKVYMLNITGNNDYYYGPAMEMIMGTSCWRTSSVNHMVKWFLAKSLIKAECNNMKGSVLLQDENTEGQYTLGEHVNSRPNPRYNSHLTSPSKKKARHIKTCWLYLTLPDETDHKMRLVHVVNTGAALESYDDLAISPLRTYVRNSWTDNPSYHIEAAHIITREAEDDEDTEMEDAGNRETEVWEVVRNNEGFRAAIKKQHERDPTGERFKFRALEGAAPDPQH